MSVVHFRQYKNLSDAVLLQTIYDEMERIKKLSRDQDSDAYWQEAMFLNEMIKETKRRNLRVDKQTLINHILT